MQITQLCEIFRAKVVDVADTSLTIEITGDPGKMVAFQNRMARYGIKQLARTGKVRPPAFMPSGRPLPACLCCSNMTMSSVVSGATTVCLTCITPPLLRGCPAGCRLRCGVSAGRTRVP